MNTRAPGIPPSSRLTPAILLAVVAWVVSCAPARGECGPDHARPSFPLEWARVVGPAEMTPLDKPSPPDRSPTCTGPNCTRSSFPPLASAPKTDQRPDLRDTTRVEFVASVQLSSWVERSDEMAPIGRETEIERPPCGAPSDE